MENRVLPSLENPELTTITRSLKMGLVGSAGSNPCAAKVRSNLDGFLPGLAAVRDRLAGKEKVSGSGVYTDFEQAA